MVGRMSSNNSAIRKMLIYMCIYMHLCISMYICMRDLAGKGSGLCNDKFYTLGEPDTVTVDTYWEYVNDWAFAF